MQLINIDGKHGSFVTMNSWSHLLLQNVCFQFRFWLNRIKAQPRLFMQSEDEQGGFRETKHTQFSKITYQIYGFCSSIRRPFE